MKNKIVGFTMSINILIKDRNADEMDIIMDDLEREIDKLIKSKYSNVKIIGAKVRYITEDSDGRLNISY